MRNLTVALARRSRPSPRAKLAPMEAPVFMAKVARPGHTLTMPRHRPKLPASSPVSNQVNNANKTSTAWLPSHSSVPPSVLFHCPLLFFPLPCCCFLVSPVLLPLVPLWSHSVTSLPIRLCETSHRCVGNVSCKQNSIFFPNFFYTFNNYNNLRTQKSQ